MSHLPNRNLIVNIDKNDFNLHHHVNLPKMALTVILLVAHDSARVPGQWSIFIAEDKTKAGSLYSNFGIVIGYSISPVMISSIITLGVMPGPGARFHEKMQEIGGGIKIPARAGPPDKAADSELWATEFVQGLIDNDYLEQSAMEKLRVARQLALDGPVINV